MAPRSNGGTLLELEPVCEDAMNLVVLGTPRKVRASRRYGRDQMLSRHDAIPAQRPSLTLGGSLRPWQRLLFSTPAVIPMRS
jgi:hypothetical protein